MPPRVEDACAQEYAAFFEEQPDEVLVRPEEPGARAARKFDELLELRRHMHGLLDLHRHLMIMHTVLDGAIFESGRAAHALRASSSLWDDLLLSSPAPRPRTRPASDGDRACSSFVFSPRSATVVAFSILFRRASSAPDPHRWRMRSKSRRPPPATPNAAAGARAAGSSGRTSNTDGSKRGSTRNSQLARLTALAGRGRAASAPRDATRLRPNSRAQAEHFIEAEWRDRARDCWFAWPGSVACSPRTAAAARGPGTPRRYSGLADSGPEACSWPYACVGLSRRCTS